MEPNLALDSNVIIDLLENRKQVSKEQLEFTEMLTNGQSYANLGFIYEHGMYFYAVNIHKAAELYKKGIELGNSGSMNNLAIMYEVGRHPDGEDINEAIELYNMAADLDDGWAISNLGLLYEEGTHPDGINISKAVELYEKSADLGCIEGIRNLSRIYADGIHPNGIDMLKAIEFYKKAIELKNCTYSMNKLANIYENKSGHWFLNYDLTMKAIELYEKAASLGCTDAMYNLAYLYRFSNDPRIKDTVKAIKYYKTGFMAGDYHNIIYLSEFCCQDPDYETYYDIALKNGRVTKDVKKPEKILKKLYGTIEESDCMVCLCKLLGTNSEIIVKRCGHSYHYNCVTKLTECPVCKYSFTN